MTANSFFFIAFVQRLPLVLVILAGIIFAVARWQRHPRVSLLTVTALVFYLIKVVAVTAISHWLPSLRETMHWSYATTNYLFMIEYIVSDILFAAVIIMLIAAAFTGRQPTAAAST
jgi:hypothetical protein